MLKVLYIDSLCPKGHKAFNTLTLKAVSKIALKLKIIATDSCIRKDTNIDINIPGKYFSDIGRTAISKMCYRVREYRKWKWLLQVINQEKPDLIMVSSYETISFSLASKKIKVPVLAFNHNNIDELKNKVKSFFYKEISDIVTQVVFEEYMAKYLKETIKIKNKIVVLPHIVVPSKIKKIKSELLDSEAITLFAPSSSNNFAVIADLKNRKEELLKNRITLISKFPEDLKDNALILKKYFSDKEYSDYMTTCSAVYVPLPITFNYRVSNVINEAVSCGKPIISHNNEYTRFLKSKYSSLIYIVSKGIVEECNYLRNWLKENRNSFWDDRERFLEDHSLKLFIERIRFFFLGICTR